MLIVPNEVMKWLLERSNPSVRYFTLKEIVGKPSNDEEVLSAKKQIPGSPWVKILLRKQKEKSYWLNPKSCYLPFYGATVWYLQLLAEIGMGGSSGRIRSACERFLRQHAMKDGGFSCGTYRGRHSEECVTGGMTATLMKLGYVYDARVQAATRWLLERQMEDGGWNCYQPAIHSAISISTLGPLRALASVPTEMRNRRIKAAIKRGAEFLLEHRLFKSHTTGRIIKRYWLDFRFPYHYTYDILQALRVITESGSVSDPRLSDAIEIVESKMTREGVWLLDDVPIASARPAIRLEREGRPSKWLTFTALSVLKRTGRLLVEH